MTIRYRPDEREAQAARAMLVTLKRIDKFVAAVQPKPTKELASIQHEARVAIAQAETAGIKTDEATDLS